MGAVARPAAVAALVLQRAAVEQAGEAVGGRLQLGVGDHAQQAHAGAGELGEGAEVLDRASSRK